MKEYGFVTYGEQTYKTVVIDTQTWMAENLNYNVEGSRCYGDNTGDDSQNMCSTYGRLYNWETAKTVCPSGWSLPTKDDWDKLSSYVEKTSGCSSCDATLLKAASGWDDYQGKSGNGTDEYGFSALPGGGVLQDGSLYGVGNLGFWWSASGSSSAYRRSMYYDDEYADWGYDYKSLLLSVRCLQD
jgi:uncharacterized protein (TIGR02145 family)